MLPELYTQAIREFQQLPADEQEAYRQRAKEIDAEYTAWLAGNFVPKIWASHKMAALRQATDEQLIARKRLICRLKERKFHVETININRILRQREQAELDTAAALVAGIAPVAERIEAAYQRDLRRIQQAQFDAAKQTAKATGRPVRALLVKETVAA